MRTIYLDSDYICHADYSDGRRAIQTDTLDGFGDVALESVRYIPENETYTREDGRVFYGEFSQILYDTEKEQRQYDIDMRY